MDAPRDPRQAPASDADRAWRPSGLGFIVALLAGAAALTLLLTWWTPSAPDAPTAQAAAAPPAPVQAASISPIVPGGAPTPDPEGDADPTADLSSYVARGENPSVAEVIERLHQRGIYSGLGAFSPPGTSPPLVGLAVPEDFVLPKGYVRHHQATDDGQPIEAILMFAPGFQMLDASGRPIAMPANGVVPPELAPAGLALRKIVIPPPANGGR
ncbi:hypothetical protein [Massilia sp. CF038]|uniref:hypothetical protein n=1 Tax=Massilia sp. CF038 TaxID=1881045 RepID=UPI00091C7715|nr:hypothetical protein [Massilia sp. CF038]SHG72306.1 hypothetical protein SAMN05428948_1765 [Massilia sp. CF038]